MAKKLVFLSIASLFIQLGTFLMSQQSFASGTVTVGSDTITTSRPSASSPLNADQAANAASVSVVDNGSIFLASDSANFWPDTGETGNYGISVGTMSAQISGSPNTRTIQFTSTVSNAHHKGDAVYVPITAMHKITFKTTTTIPASGKIIIGFPGGGSNLASPSATTFSFNGLATGDISYKLDGTRTCTFTISAPNITCTMDSGGTLAAGTTVTFLVGCADGSSNETACSAQRPRLINPTKTTANICNNNDTTCTADSWKINLTTQDGSSNNLDTGSVKIGVNESVQVVATVEPSLSYTLTGLADGTNLHTQNSNCGSSGDVSNTGVAATATNVNLGSLGNGVINKAFQEFSVSTNGSSGYVITATSSGRFIDPDNGFWLPDANGGNGLTANDTPAPATFGASGTPAFGIHACGSNSNSINTSQWAGTSDTAFSSGAKYSNPWNTAGNDFYNTITSATGAVSADKTEIEYAATIGPLTPAGTYRTVLTYVVTATF